ncbi:Uncharacterised protein [Serratia odorifera]|uniref:Uncharacterized protein n=1 Tax=Serratia odorifera TaxID=618 RepID=A0A447L193_SEROD|nr:Uncharacterised protein [Serratia odorifera]
MANIYRVVAEHVAPRKGFSDVVQPTGPIMSGQLHQGANMQLTYNSLIQLNYNDSLELGNSLILPQTCAAGSRVKHDSPEHYSYSCSPEHKHCLGLKVPTKFVATCTPGIQRNVRRSFPVNQQVADKEKGRTANPTLWDYCFLNHQDYQYIAVTQDNKVALGNPVTYENFVDQPSGDSLVFFRCRRLISLRAAVIKNPAVLSPSSLTCSMDSKSSRGSLTDTWSDLLFFLPVAITESRWNWWCSVCTDYFAFQLLTWCSPENILVVFTLIVSWCKNGNAPECGNTAEASNHIVKWSNNMACSHDTQTRPKFVYLFLGTPNEFPDSTPTVASR